MPERPEEEAVKYQEYLATIGEECPFCDLVVTPTSQVIESYQTTMLVDARFPYSGWDNYAVIDHLMIIPKQHRLNLKEMSESEWQECVAVFKKYESKGYSVYARSSANRTRTIPHVHIHLFLLDETKKL